MDIYLYTAQEIFTQKKIKGEMVGESKEKIYNQLVEKNLYPYTIQKKTILNRSIHLFKTPIKMEEICFFCRQFAAMLQAGIGMMEALEICIKQSQHKAFRQHLQHIQEKVGGGKTLSQALEEEKIFPEILVRLVGCGEQSGNLDKVMKRALECLENQLKIRKKIKKALAYPMLVMGLVSIVLAILMIRVIPAYMHLLQDTGATIPLPTKIVMDVSNFLRIKWKLLLGSVTSGLLCWNTIKKKLPVRKKLHHLYLKLPIVEKIIRQNLTACFASTMSMLIQSGIPILSAMKMTKEVMNYQVAEVEIQEAIVCLQQGNSLVSALSGSKIYPPILLSMIGIGEESGKLDEMLEKMGEYFRQEVEGEMEWLTILIEPIMMIIVGIIVGGVMAAVILPTFAAVTATI